MGTESDVIVFPHSPPLLSWPARGIPEGKIWSEMLCSQFLKNSPVSGDPMANVPLSSGLGLGNLLKQIV